MEGWQVIATEVHLGSDQTPLSHCVGHKMCTMWCIWYSEGIVTLPSGSRFYISVCWTNHVCLESIRKHTLRVVFTEGQVAVWGAGAGE